MQCGDFAKGFARVRCDECSHEYLLAFSCKGRWFCPSCHQKKVQIFGAMLAESILAAVPHRQPEDLDGLGLGPDRGPGRVGRQGDGRLTIVSGPTLFGSEHREGTISHDGVCPSETFGRDSLRWRLLTRLNRRRIYVDAGAAAQ